MTLPQKLILLIGVPAALGVGYLQRTEIHLREAEIIRLSREVSHTRQTFQRLKARSDNTATEAPARALTESAPLASSGDPIADERMRSLVRRVYQLKRWIEQTPDQNLPELRFASDGAWFDVVSGFPQLDREQDLRLAVALLKRRAQFSFFALFQSALGGYLKTSNNVLPTRVDDLMPFFVCPIDDALLARYEMCTAGSVGKWDTPVVQEKADLSHEGPWETVSCNGMRFRISSSFPSRGRLGL